jgi:RNA polymerase sigma factor (sigma-70 family)
MPDRSLPAFLRRLRRLTAGNATSALTDAELVGRFTATGDRAAFELLVWRHGQAVLGVCGRLLGHAQDAEDAFQATFLTLARKAGSIGRKESVGGWLYTVAYRVALRARAGLRRRARREQRLTHEPAVEPTPDVLWRDLRPVLDEEVNRLPEKYRRPLVLCYLIGKTTDEAARELGTPRGTVAARLAWARQLLRTRLARRGLAPSAALLAAALAGHAAAAPLPVPLVGSTADAAAAVAAGSSPAPGVAARADLWSQGVLRAMWFKKLRNAVALVAITAAALAAAADRMPARPTPRTQPTGGGPPPERRAAPAARLLPVGGIVWALAWSPDGKVLATASCTYEPVDPQDATAGVVDTSTVKLWDVRSGRERTTLGAEAKTRIQRLAFAPDGKLLAMGVNYPTEVNRSEVRLLDLQTGLVRHSIAFPGHLGGVAFAPDGKTLAFGGMIQEGGGRTLVLKLWDVAKGQERAEFKRRALAELVNGTWTLRADISSLLFAPDGATLATVEGDRAVRLWDARTGKLRQTLEGHDEATPVIAFAPDGKTLASADTGQTVLLWDLKTGKVRRRLTGTRGPVHRVAFSPDGKTVAAAGAVVEGEKATEEVLLWDARTGELRRRLAGAEGLALAVAFSPDGRTLAVGSGRTRQGKQAGEVRLRPVE